MTPEIIQRRIRLLEEFLEKAMAFHQDREQLKDILSADDQHAAEKRVAKIRPAMARMVMPLQQALEGVRVSTFVRIAPPAISRLKPYKVNVLKDMFAEPHGADLLSKVSSMWSEL